jgi:hypothetical protein
MTHKKLSKNPGIYLIQHELSGKSYVGQSNDIFIRWSQHKKELNSGSHHNKPMQKLWNSSAETNFKFSIIKHSPIGLSSLEVQRWLVNEERRIYLVLKAKGIALNEVEPEIVATKIAAKEYQNSIKESSKKRDDKISAKRKMVKEQIALLKKSINVKSARLFNLELKYRSKSALLKKSTGWRGLFNTRVADYNPDLERQLLGKLTDEISVISPEVKSIGKEIFELQNEYRDLYRQFSKVADKASARAMWYGIGRLPSKTKISER